MGIPTKGSRRGRSTGPGQRRGKTLEPPGPAGFGFARMSRKEAIDRVVYYMRRSLSHTLARRLIHLFHLQAEELVEAGMPYELVRVLERHYVL